MTLEGIRSSLRGAAAILAMGIATAIAPAQSVPSAPPATAVAQDFADSHEGVRFQVPPGWTLTHHDGELSNFFLDVHGSPRNSIVRGVAGMDFNPFPRSTFSGALLYFTVQPQSDELTCAKEAHPATGQSDVISIGSVAFQHAHNEYGKICTESRDDVYTAFRRHTCYRFDLEVNTFCAVSSGAQELAPEQLHDIDARLAGILSTVTFSWSKSGAQKVPAPDAPATPRIPLKP